MARIERNKALQKLLQFFRFKYLFFNYHLRHWRLKILVRIPGILHHREKAVPRFPVQWTRATSLTSPAIGPPFRPEATPRRGGVRRQAPGRKQSLCFVLCLVVVAAVPPRAAEVLRASRVEFSLRVAGIRDFLFGFGFGFLARQTVPEVGEGGGFERGNRGGGGREKWGEFLGNFASREILDIGCWGDYGEVFSEVPRGRVRGNGIVYNDVGIPFRTARKERGLEYAIQSEFQCFLHWKTTKLLEQSLAFGRRSFVKELFGVEEEEKREREIEILARGRSLESSAFWRRRER